MAGNFSDSNEFKFPFPNFVDNKNGSQTEDGTISDEDNHLILSEEMEVKLIEDLLWELEALKQNFEIANAYPIDLLFEFEEFVQTLENDIYMSLGGVLNKEAYLLQDIMDMIDDGYVVLDVLLDG